MIPNAHANDPNTLIGRSRVAALPAVPAVPVALAVPLAENDVDVAVAEPDPDVVLPVGAACGAEAVDAVFTAVADEEVSSDKSKVGNSSELHRSGRLLAKINCWSSGHALMHSICGSPDGE